MKKYTDDNTGLQKALQDAIQPTLRNMVLNYMSEHNVACAKIHAVWVSKTSGNIVRDDNGTHCLLTARKYCPENVFLLTLWLSSEKDDKAEEISQEVVVEFSRELDLFRGHDFDWNVIGWDIKGFCKSSDSNFPDCDTGQYFMNRYYSRFTNFYDDPIIRRKAFLKDVLGRFWNEWRFDEVPAPLVVNFDLSINSK